jgi:hypothetical protein
MVDRTSGRWGWECCTFECCGFYRQFQFTAVLVDGDCRHVTNTVALRRAGIALMSIRIVMGHQQCAERGSTRSVSRSLTAPRITAPQERDGEDRQEKPP